jgi:hypothetical protein
MYTDPSYKRQRDYLDVNEHEMARAKKAAAELGMQYGAYKRYALNNFTQAVISGRVREINTGVCDV